MSRVFYNNMLGEEYGHWTGHPPLGENKAKRDQQQKGEGVISVRP